MLLKNLIPPTMLKFSNSESSKMIPCTRMIFLLVLSLHMHVSGQDSLALKNILALGLEKNFSLIIARNNEQISNNNLDFAKYAFLPIANANGRKSNSVVNSTQEFASGTTQERTGAKSNSLTGTVSLDWTVFDGFAMFVGYSQVKKLSELGKLNTRMSVENLISQIATEYYNLIRQTQLLESMRTGMRLSSERLAIASEKYKIGSFSRLEFLQAQGDFNADSSAFLRQEEAVTTSKLELNRILAFDLNIPENWADSIEIEKTLFLDNLLQNTYSRNASLLIASQNQVLSELDIRAIRSRYYPSLSLNAGYNYTNSQSQSGFLLSNRTNGITYGATLNWSLFNGLENRRQIKNAKIERENKDLEYENLKLSVTSSLNQVWNNYTNNLRILSLETQNLSSAHENLDIAMARYRLGDLAGIEMRQIQMTFLDASNRFISAQYLAKIAEITLKQISGEIEQYL